MIDTHKIESSISDFFQGGNQHTITADIFRLNGSNYLASILNYTQTSITMLHNTRNNSVFMCLWVALAHMGTCLYNN